MARAREAGLWNSDDRIVWRAALDRYDDVIASYGAPKLVELDRWYRHELPGLVAARSPKMIDEQDLARIVEWKMRRGVFRPRNLALARQNSAADVVAASTAAFAATGNFVKAVGAITGLRGIGVATASAVLAVVEPNRFPFLDDVVTAQVPGLKAEDYGLRAYGLYAAALRERATQIGSDWMATDIERALFAFIGGKAGLAPR